MQYAHLGYLDPGSGSFILQIFLAALLGLGVAVRASWSRIKKFIGRNQEEDHPSDNDDATQ